MLNPKATDDDIDGCDDEDHNSGSVVQIISCLLVPLIIDIKTSYNQ